MSPSDPSSRGDDDGPVASIEDVTFAYAERPVLEGVTLDIEAGTFLGLVGPNGSGKTTLLELVLGLRRPDRGSVRLFGEPAHTFDDGERIGYVPQQSAATERMPVTVREAVTMGDDGERIGYVPQQSAATERMPVTVREAVTMGRYPHRAVGRFSATDREAIDSALDRAGIADLSDRRVGKLSGGQRQRVFLARALAAEADLLALDEPTIGVDAESRERFYGLLGDLNASGLTIVLIEHDIGVVTEHATQVACLNRHLYFDGKPEEFVHDIGVVTEHATQVACLNRHLYFDGKPEEFVTTDALAEAYGTDQHVLQHGH
ncbi:metal ABC transporter ATP-binding protein [Halococcus hamelinensis]|uniref:Zinc ABC transporter ATP-binding protein n=1 Tax=Halococcus hamelinensis 100A6 TaxID=1132509 RepID=M0M8Q5_9EURY|nr:metal ABC transporter ATP-binding protein [Halococcus hamelinensis]EMA42111.1 zinc ABC transporter ATP-binding protein [Halococcus hamelinensis 100A6]